MKNYVQLYRQFAERIKENSAPVLNKFRDASFAEFEQKGFPDKKTEAYLNSSLIETLNTDYDINIHQLDIDTKQDQLFQCKIPSINAALGFMLNDRFYMADNQRRSLPEGIEFCALSDAERLYPEVVGRYLHTLSDKSRDAMTAFNSAFVQNGSVLATARMRPRRRGCRFLRLQGNRSCCRRRSKVRVLFAREHHPKSKQPNANVCNTTK